MHEASSHWTRRLPCPSPATRAGAVALCGLGALLVLAALLTTAARAQEGGPRAEEPRFLRTIGGPPPLGFLNDPQGVAASRGEDGRLYAVDAANARIQVFSAAGLPLGQWGVRGADAELGELWRPSDIALSPDGHQAFVVDRGHARVYRFRTDDECIKGENRPRSCLERAWGGRGRGEGLFEAPVGIAVDRSRRVFVVDQANDVVQVFDADGAYAGSLGDAEGRGRLLRPTDVAIGQDGTVWVADYGNHRIARFRASGGYVGEFSGPGTDPFYRPSGIAVDPDGGFVVADHRPENLEIRLWRFEASTRLLWEIALEGAEAPRGAAVNQHGLAIKPDGEVVSAHPNHAQFSLWRISRLDALQMPFALRGRERDGFDLPLDVAIDEAFFAVADTGNARVLLMPHEPARILETVILGGLINGDAGLKAPSGVAVHRHGPGWSDARVLVADPPSHDVFVFAPDGRLLERWGEGEPVRHDGGFSHPVDVAVGEDGEVFVADQQNNRIVRRSPEGEVLGVIGTPGNGPGQMEYPTRIAFGPQGLLYVLERNRNRVQAFRPDGTFVREWKGALEYDARPGRLWSPLALAGDAERLYVMENDERDHVRIQVFAPDAALEKELADVLVASFAQGPGAGKGKLWNPRGLDAATDGRVLVADSGNNRLQLFDAGAPDAMESPEPSPTPPPTEPVATTTPGASATPEPGTATPASERPTATPEPSASAPAPETPTVTAEPSATATASATDDPVATATPEPSATVSPEPSVAPTDTATVTATAAATEPSPSSPTPTTEPGTAEPTATEPPPSVETPQTNNPPTPQMGAAKRVFVPIALRR